MLIKKIIKEKIPTHIAIIMDGNGRWAKKKGKIRSFGHKKGVDALKKIVEAAVEIDIKYITLFAFSVENWKRPKDEVNALMNLLIYSLNSEINNL